VEKIIYAIIDANKNNANVDYQIKNIKGLNGSDLFVISFQEISAVVSNFDTSKYSIKKELAIDFARVIDELSHLFTLLPIRFGTFLKSDEIITQLLTDHYQPFHDNLEKVRGKDEFGLKLLWDYDKSKESIRAEVEKEDLNPADYFSKNTVNTNYLLEKMKKYRLEDALLKHVEHFIDEISSLLAQINPDCRFNKMLSPSIILDAVFLVEKQRKGEFIQVIENLKQQHADLHFLLTGPWPPYSFMEILIDN